MVDDAAAPVQQEGAAALVDLHLGRGLTQELQVDVHADDAHGVVPVVEGGDVGDHVHADVGVVVRVHPHGDPGLHRNVVPAHVLQIVLLIEAHVRGHCLDPGIGGQIHVVPEPGGAAEVLGVVAEVHCHGPQGVFRNGSAELGDGVGVDPLRLAAPEEGIVDIRQLGGVVADRRHGLLRGAVVVVDDFGVVIRRADEDILGVGVQNGVGPERGREKKHDGHHQHDGGNDQGDLFLNGLHGGRSPPRRKAVPFSAPASCSRCPRPSWPAECPQTRGQTGSPGRGSAPPGPSPGAVCSGSSGGWSWRRRRRPRQ